VFAAYTPQEERSGTQEGIRKGGKEGRRKESGRGGREGKQRKGGEIERHQYNRPKKKTS